MITLFPYQSELQARTNVALGAYQHVLMQLPTGGGKSACFTDAASKAIRKNRCVLIISESLKIYAQIRKYFPSKVHEISDGVKDVPVQRGHLYLAMAQTLIRRKHLIEQFAALGKECIVIVDEAHIGTHTKVLLQLLDCYILGVTATPNLKDAPHLIQVYKHIVCGPTILELINLGRLTPYRHFERQVVDLRRLKKVGRDYSEASQESAFQQVKVYSGLLEDIRTTPFKMAMIYCASIKHAMETTQKLREAGYLAVNLHTGISPEEHEANFILFSRLEANIGVSVGAYTKGYDDPELDLIVLMRATVSLSAYIQMCGRGGRVLEGKRIFTVLDYGGNGTRHKCHWDADHDWETLWKTLPPKRKESVPLVKLCPKCDYMLSVSAQECPNCGHVFVKPPPTEEETKLVELTALVVRLEGRYASTLSPADLAAWATLKGKSAYAIRVAMGQEQLKEGFLPEFAKCMGYKNGWVWQTRQRITKEKIFYKDLKVM